MNVSESDKPKILPTVERPLQKTRKKSNNNIKDMKFDESTVKVFHKAVYILYDGNTYKNLRKEATVALLRHIPVMQCKMTPRQRSELGESLTPDEMKLISDAEQQLGD